MYLHEGKMKIWCVFILLLALVSFVSAASTLNTFSAQGSGSIMRNLDTTWESAKDGVSIGGTSGSVILTGSGDFRYQTKDITDATENNHYNSTGYSQFTDGGVFTESVSMTDQDVGQTASVSQAGILGSAEIQTARFVSDANLSMGQQASWDGSGFYSRDLQYGIDISRTVDKNEYRYQGSSTEHSWISTNQTGGAIVRPEFSFTDFSDAYLFRINSTEIVNGSPNTTEATNETGGNST
jgi:hypothetical protein